MNDAAFFKENDYLFVRGIVSPDELYAHLLSLKANGAGMPDLQVTGSHIFYKEDKFERLMETLLPEIEAYTSCRLYKTYSFARQYINGNVLRAHKDREACEVTVTICLGNDGKSWPIWFLDKDEKPQAIGLEPGDGLIFKGHSHLHWREKNVFGACGQVFLHYVDQNGPFAMHRDDVTKGRRLYFQMKIPFMKRIFRCGVERLYV